MRLLDLDPQWLELDGKRVGFTFISPKQKPHKRADGTLSPNIWRQSCFAVKLPHRVQWELFEKAGHESVQGCNPDCAWTIDGGIEKATFETITVSPSLDGSRGGFWHGHIIDGKIVGGI